MTSRRAWETYPSSYRKREMKILADWIQTGESGSIVGLAGAGKSNLLGFLTHRPDTITAYLRHQDRKLALILVDLNNLVNHELATFYRVILRALYEASPQLTAIANGTLIETIEQLYRKVEEKTDPFLVQSALREVLFLCRENEVSLVLVLDPFDPFCRTAPTQVLDSLRGLRDSFKSTLSYLVGLRQALAYVRDPRELGELFEILDLQTVWLGAMETNDARWVIQQVEDTMDQAFTADQINTLLHLTGGYPALLKAASLWLVRNGAMLATSAWEEHLFREPTIQNRLQKISLGLTREETAVLSVLHQTLSVTTSATQTESIRQLEKKYQGVLNRLQEKHLCQKTETTWRLFSPLFARFLSEMVGLRTGKIWHDAQTDHFFSGDQVLSNLTNKDRHLLRYFLNKPQIVHTIDDLVEAAWPEDDGGGVSNETVQQAIRHLRKQVEPNPAKPCYLITERKIGYRFFPEGAPHG